MQACKNCQAEISTSVNYCPFCGAKVIHRRITFKNMVNESFANFFGWDSRFFFTLKQLVVKPEEVLNGYLNGVRKKFVHPFVLLTLCSALALIIFNTFSERFSELNSTYMDQQFEIMAEMVPHKSEEAKLEYIEKQKQQSEVIAGYIFKYLNIIGLVNVPIYAFISFLVYRRNNYGEHIIINAYLQAFIFLVSIITFFIGLAVHPSLYYLSFPFTVLFYLYVFHRKNNLTLKESFISFLKFLIAVVFITIAFAIVLVVLGVIIGLIIRLTRS